jgi:hypothetical protein
MPTALMKSLSGSGARALSIEAMKTYGVDSFVGRLVAILQGASDTTFYIIALYFGSVGIKRTRYAVAYGLLADWRPCWRRSRRVSVFSLTRSQGQEPGIRFSYGVGQVYHSCPG